LERTCRVDLTASRIRTAKLTPESKFPYDDLRLPSPAFKRGRIVTLKLLHPELDAYTHRFEDALLDEIRDSYRRELATLLENPRNQYLFQGGRSHRARIGKSAPYFALSFESYPLLWFSNNDEKTFAIFRRFFDALAIENEIRKLVDFQQRIIMYCGFLVIGDRAPAAQWHCDYAPDANAFTLITPLFELEPGHGHLLYRLGREANGCAAQRYEYKLGEAILFGENTAHTTEPYEPSAKKRILVSMTFGTDKLEYWPYLKESLDTQAPYFMLPCGHMYGSCKCLKISMLERLSRWVQQRIVPTSEITS
jgi:hypothetical protein